jgi:hypothetical protein
MDYYEIEDFGKSHNFCIHKWLNLYRIPNLSLFVTNPFKNGIIPLYKLRSRRDHKNYLDFIDSIVMNIRSRYNNEEKRDNTICSGSNYSR